ncbi:hypothetical protein GGQ77_003274 [Geobacillus thermodenitrificans]|uniref:hypothetical protein n=1 Tax=Geobacillus thermodenitrificans TaxID=33940 RepID=UPI002E0A59A9|nr:hypothetical protein [Geobacillus thermodenitrificans]
MHKQQERLHRLLDKQQKQPRPYIRKNVLADEPSVISSHEPGRNDKFISQKDCDIIADDQH